MTPLSSLTGLTFLNLQVNQIANVDSLSGLTDLTDLYLWARVPVSLLVVLSEQPGVVRVREMLEAIPQQGQPQGRRRRRSPRSTERQLGATPGSGAKASRWVCSTWASMMRSAHGTLTHPLSTRRGIWCFVVGYRLEFQRLAVGIGTEEMPAAGAIRTPRDPDLAGVVLNGEAVGLVVTWVCPGTRCGQRERAGGLTNGQSYRFQVRALKGTKAVAVSFIEPGTPQAPVTALVTRGIVGLRQRRQTDRARGGAVQDPEHRGRVGASAAETGSGPPRTSSVACGTR